MVRFILEPVPYAAAEIHFAPASEVEDPNLRGRRLGRGLAIVVNRGGLSAGTRGWGNGVQGGITHGPKGIKIKELFPKRLVISTLIVIRSHKGPRGGIPLTDRNRVEGGVEAATSNAGAFATVRRGPAACARAVARGKPMVSTRINVAAGAFSHSHNLDSSPLAVSGNLMARVFAVAEVHRSMDTDRHANVDKDSDSNNNTTVTLIVS